ncbi:MAG: hypothetical protein H6760_01770 [Candidatus Nomurabacteria bacterium]|nr:MAG: hypothetical protein H6760_01770 [Candidatus Nomurabacteria bacterium]
MSLVFAAIAPHPPQLSQEPNPGSSDQLQKTRQAYHTLAQQLYAAKPDLLVILSPHEGAIPAAWEITVGETLKGDLKEFSDFSAQLEVPGSIAFSHRLKERAEDHRFPLLLQSGQQLDYATVLSAMQTMPHLPNARLVSLMVANTNNRAQYEFGKMLREEIFATNERVAVLASANLSYKRGKNSPAGYTPKASALDARIMEALLQGDEKAILHISNEEAEEAKMLGLGPLSLLLGVLYRKHFFGRILAYEYPFGVGYCTCILETH